MKKQADRVTCYVDSPVGRLRLIAADEGLLCLHFAEHRRAPVTAAREVDGHPVLGQAREELFEYFAGERTRFDTSLAPPALRGGTAFQHAVWRALLEIPFGETQSYVETARRIGRPSAVRAVGAANAVNPLSIFVPCHRVVGASGSLTGYAGGVETKRWLLEHERAKERRWTSGA